MFYTILIDEKNSSIDSNKETKSEPIDEAVNINISQSDAEVNSEGKLYQKAYVSMKGELVGDCLDADSFEMSGEGAMAHGWGNYLLKNRKTNKIRYFDRWNERKVFYKGKEVGFKGMEALMAYYLDKQQDDGLSNDEIINISIEKKEWGVFFLIKRKSWKAKSLLSTQRGFPTLTALLYHNLTRMSNQSNGCILMLGKQM